MISCVEYHPEYSFFVFQLRFQVTKRKSNKTLLFIRMIINKVIILSKVKLLTVKYLKMLKYN